MMQLADSPQLSNRKEKCTQISYGDIISGDVHQNWVSRVQRVIMQTPADSQQRKPS